MFKLDHIVIETKTPLEDAQKFAKIFKLPFAWPLMEKEDYRSVGINLSNINIEFIDFNVRFGIKNNSKNGFSAVAYKIESEIQEVTSFLKKEKLNYKIAEECESHTTITIEENKIYPTLFLVKYHFDISGWQNRLKEEFEKANGGKYMINKLLSLSIDTKLEDNILENFEHLKSGKNIITFLTNNENNHVESLENLEFNFKSNI